MSAAATSTFRTPILPLSCRRSGSMDCKTPWCVLQSDRGARRIQGSAMLWGMSGPQGPIEPAVRAERPIDPNVRIGHVHLRTADIDRVRDFYVGILGFEVVAEARDVPGWGTTGDVLFVSAGGYHHHLGFNTWKSAAGGPQPDGVAGLHHVAIRYPTRAGLADALRRLRSVDWPLRQTADHGTHEAIYITDPDGNDLELCWDRPFDQWPVDGAGHLRGEFGEELDLDELLASEPG